MLIELLGWAGVVGMLAAYVLAANGRMAASSLRYAALNAVGGVFCAFAAGIHGAWPSAASSAVWAAVGLYTLALAATTRLRPRGVVIRARFGRVAERSELTEGSIAC